MTSTLSRSAETAAGQQVLPPSMVERMTLILDLFDRPYARLTLEEVVQRTHLPRSTTHRIIEQLVRLHWLDHTTVGYRLGQRSLELGGRDVGQSSLRNAAAPVLDQLATRTRLVVHLAVLDGTEIHYLDKIGSRSTADVPSRVGARAPAHCTALGKAMLAWCPPEWVDVRYQGGLSSLTSRSISDLGLLHQELSRIRDRRGLAFERGECFPDIACIGIALRGPDGPLGAISVVGDGRTALDRLAPVISSAARAITDELLGHKDQAPHVKHSDVRSPTWSNASVTQLLAFGQRDDWL